MDGAEQLKADFDKLLPELRKALVVEPDINMAWIYHPLVHTGISLDSYYVSRNSHEDYPSQEEMANRTLLFKKKRLKEAEEEEDWDTWVFTHERPYRFEALEYLWWECLLDWKKRWNLAAHVWMDSENIWQNKEGWREIWEEAPTRPRYCMDEEERAKLRRFPSEFVIYRGFSYPGGEVGLSWTRDREKAIWFAYRKMKGTPHLTTGRVRKRDVRAYFNGRKEDEVVVLPESVTGIVISDLPPKEFQD